MTSAELEKVIKNVLEAKSIPDAFYRIASERPSAVVYTQAKATPDDIESETPRTYTKTTYSESKSRISKIAKYLQTIGVVPGSKIAVLCGTRPEWMEADIAILACGGVTVSIYQSLLVDDIAYMLYDSGSEVVIAENQEQVDKLLEVISNEHAIPATEDREATKAKVSLKSIIAIEQVNQHKLITQLSEILQGEEQDAPKSIDSIELRDLAALVYTSGTTGPPKGVMQTHQNHLANVRQSFESQMLTDCAVLSLFLPLAHSFAKLIGYLGFLTPVELRFTAIIDPKSSKLDPKSITKDIRESGATIFPVVPRLLEKMRDGVAAAKTEGGLKAVLIGLTLDSAKAVFEANKKNSSAPLKAKMGYAITGGLRKKIRKKLFGDDFDYCLSGGAKLPIDVGEFFAAIGIDVIEGFGLTETAVATNVGRRGETPIGSVGPTLSDDIEIRIENDGEILIRGPNVAVGYFNRKTATNKAWDTQGWYHTGDLGSLDEHGNLYIVGRKKDIIVTSGGKNIAPHDIEVQVKGHPFVSQAVLIGDGRKYCIAVVSLNDETTKRWAKQERIPESTELYKDGRVQAKIWKHIEKMNEGLSSHETVKKLFIAPEEFSVENGQLTPTFKVKRSLIVKMYQEQIDALFE